MRPLENLKQVRELKVDQTSRLHSAEHEEITGGMTTDIYFIKTREILDKLDLGNTEVTAEVFTRREGILVGVEEVRTLLAGTGVKVWSLKEGDGFSPNEVVMRLQGPYNKFGFYETVFLGMLASSSGWATRAREAKQAAGDKPVYCFGARHVHPAVAPVMERAAIIGGADGASCILGAKLLGREPAGTVPHAIFLIVGDTVKVAKAYDELMPPEALRLVLVDTFKDEVEDSLRVAEALSEKLDGIRLDTASERGGVTPGLVNEVRCRLDRAGYARVKIFVSGGLVPERIIALSEAGADAFGVGSFISAAPPIDMTMDIKEVNGKPVAKRGRIPGITENPRLERLL